MNKMFFVDPKKDITSLIQTNLNLYSGNDRESNVQGGSSYR